MNIEIWYYYKLSGESFDYMKNGELISSLEYDYSEWYIIYFDDYNKKMNKDKICTYKISYLTPEQYFQESIAWDYPFPFESAYSIINKAYKNNNKFDNFSTEINYYIKDY